MSYSSFSPHSDKLLSQKRPNVKHIDSFVKEYWAYLRLRMLEVGSLPAGLLNMHGIGKKSEFEHIKA